MNAGDNTLLMRLAGPMQSWGTSSRLQLRRTDRYPSKSGVLGMLLCARGVRREDSKAALEPLDRLLMGVRVDRGGTLDWDYHTAGANIGIRSAEGKPKKTASTKEYEALLSRRQYLYDASFLIALQGDESTVEDCDRALDEPVWPIFLGRKSCVPGEPVLVGTGRFGTVEEALASVPWQPRLRSVDHKDRSDTPTLDVYIEHPPGTPPPAGARLVYDTPRIYGFYSHIPRWVVPGEINVKAGEESLGALFHSNGYSGKHDQKHWEEVRLKRLELDCHLCVFCKSPAVDVHHVTYASRGRETPDDLRSLCKRCHDACTMIEYSHGMATHRVDPLDPGRRGEILEQIERLVTERRYGHRRRIREAARATDVDFFHDAPILPE